MLPAPLPSDEAVRWAALRELGLMDTPHNAEFDAIVQVAALACDVPISLLSLLGEDRQWFKAQVGLEGISETPRNEAFCGYTILGEGILEIDDARQDARFSGNPLVVGSPGVRFYAGIPLKLSDSTHAGTLCVIDSRVRHLDDRQRAILAALSVTASHALENWSAKRKQRVAEEQLARKRQRIDDLVAATNVGTWEWNVRTGALNTNRRHAAIYGFDTEDDLALGKAKARFAAVHPDDLPGLMEKINGHFAGRSDCYDHEYRMQHRDGHMVWTRTHGTVMTRAADGSPEWVFGTVEDISERKHQEAALAKGRAFLDQIGRLAGVGGWELELATGGMAWSAGTYAIHGVGPDFVPTLDGVQRFYPAEAQGVLRVAMERAAAGEGGWDLELPFVQAAGRNLWIRTIGSVVFEDAKPARLIGAIMDVTEDVAHRRALEVANERVTLATETAGIGIWEWDLEAGTIAWGDRMFGLYGRHPNDSILTHDDWLQGVHPEDRDRVELAARTAAEGHQSYQIEFRTVWDDGSVHFIHASALSYGDRQGQVTRMLGVNWDVTEARLLAAERDERERELHIVNTELERAGRHLVRARDEADRASRAKSYFLAGMSHELRTPLNGILGYAQLLQMEGGLSALQGCRVASMLDAGTHLLDMINSVLELSEIENGSVALRPVEVELSKIALASLDLVRPRADAKGLRLSCSTALDAARSLVTDQTRLRQIILNLLGNAVKFTERGQVELRLRAVPGRAALRIEIADTGPGVAPDQRASLFKDFERLHANVTGTVEGAGLGLALSSRLAALLGGHIGYDDNPGGGSIFWIELPLNFAPAPAPAPKAAGPDNVPEAAPLQAGGEIAGAPRLRVLVVDDLAMNRDIACSFLRVAGHDTVCAHGGAEAVAAVLAGGIDVVLMDVRMPEVDGLEATRRIRRLDPPACQIPIIGLTAQAFLEQVQACTQAGMDGHVSKPYTPETLREAVLRAAALPRDRIQQQQDASPPSADPTPAELPVLDAEAVRRMAEYLSPPVIDTYLRTIVSRCQAVSAALQAAALQAPGAPVAFDGPLAEAVHTLAGSAGMLGFVRLSHDGVRLEHAMRGGLPELPLLAARLASSIAATLDEVDRLPALRPPDWPPAGAAGPLRGEPCLCP